MIIRAGRPALLFGPVAQLGERTVRIRKVESSILFVSTIKTTPSEWFFFFVNASLEVFVWGYLMKTALITGASRGIGRAVARELAHQGWAVGINYLNRADKARELVEELTAAGCHAAMFQADVADSAAVAEMVELDYVNDDRYAETRAHGLLMARKSRRAAAQNLRQKGLNSQQIEQALETVYAPDENGESPELEAAAALVASRYRKKLADGRRDLVVAALQRRGFAYAVINGAIRRTDDEL